MLFKIVAHVNINHFERQTNNISKSKFVVLVHILETFYSSLYSIQLDAYDLISPKECF